ncbi:MFS transporter [Nocardia alni]|uniref:MFS transporter n=1 Tax=Nocardia alni TaxID=2815723 RepID=UPI001C227B0B|nr:MFS transporter [Nocardia alni]
MTTTLEHPPQTDQVNRALDEAPPSIFHLKAAVVSGMGFFTDAYDLNVISTALLLLKPEYHLSAGQVGLIGSTSLIASFVGAVLFGRLGDLVGRKRIYGLEAAIMVIGAVGSALSPNFTWLLIARFVLGIGIGGDYPISATIMTEYANRRSRGKQVAMMFSTYTFGQIGAFMVGLTLLAAGVNHDLAWRLMLGLGALPALGVLYSRRRMPESPRFTAFSGDRPQAVRDLNSLLPGAVDKAGEQIAGPSARGSWRTLFTSRTLLLTLLGTAGAWFAYDVAVYGNSISQPAIINSVISHPSPVEVTAINLILAVVFALTGLCAGIWLMDRIPRRVQQIIGLAVSGVALLAIGLLPGVTTHIAMFVILFGMSSFGSTFGPCLTTMVLGAEMFPIGVRATAHGLSAGIGKIGAYVGALVAPVLLADIGLPHTELLAGVVFLIGIPLTLVLREPSGRALN